MNLASVDLVTTLRVWVKLPFIYMRRDSCALHVNFYRIRKLEFFDMPAFAKYMTICSDVLRLFLSFAAGHSTHHTSPSRSPLQESSVY